MRPFQSFAVLVPFRRALLAALALTVPLNAAVPKLDLTEFERYPALEPDEALASLSIKPGFRIELMAAEPLVRDPIDICFDENGRLFVVEMIDYSERRGEQPHLGRIRLLEDTNRDGRYDRSQVFAEDLPWPTGLFCWAGGLLVAATPNIWFLQDTTGDGRADQRRIVFTGFAQDYAPYETNRLNVQAMLNSFRWGLDNRVHAVTSFNGGRVHAPARPDDPPVQLRNRDFAFDPRTLRLEPQAGGGQYGMSFDDAGNRFTCSNSDHARVFLYETRYADRNPFVSLPPSVQSIAADGPAAPVFRHSPDEPWRVVRTRWRVDGLVPGPIEGGGRPSGYFTSASGIMIYRGDAWPEEYRENLFVTDCGSNLLHRKITRRHGVEWIAQRPNDEQTVEFLASTDTWFRPVQLANAPDGTLWMIDMYREIIEHPWSLPPGLKEHLDLNAGNDRGRLYRIVPDSWQPRSPPQLGQADTLELVQTLEHPNAWHRETAARLLFERQPSTIAVPALQQLLAESPSPLGRLHALYALHGQDALDPATVLRAIMDVDERVRIHAIRLSEPFLAPTGSPSATALIAALHVAVDDPSPRVRYQLAFTLGETSQPERIQALSALARHNANDRWIRAAILSSLASGAVDVFESLFPIDPQETPTADRAPNDGLTAFSVDLIQMIGRQNQPDAIRRVLDHASAQTNPDLALAWIHALADGLALPDAETLRARFRPWLSQALTLAQDPNRHPDERSRAIRLLGTLPNPESIQLLWNLLRPAEPQSVQLAVLTALSRVPDLDLGPELARRWPEFTPRIREEALSILTARPERAIALLRAIESARVPRAHIDSARAAFLRDHRDPAVRDLAGTVLAVSGGEDLDERLKRFQPALQLVGDTTRGRTVFLDRCAACHRLGNEGYAVGPDLETVRHTGPDQLLSSILDPGAQVSPQYVVYEIETTDGDIHAGILIDESAASITLRQAYGVDRVLPRQTIVSLVASDRSMMPDDLDAGLDAQSMTDLIRFILDDNEDNPSPNNSPHARGPRIRPHRNRVPRSARVPDGPAVTARFQLTVSETGSAMSSSMPGHR